MSLSRSELGRKALHMAVGGFAFLLRFLSWPQAAGMALLAFLFNWQVLPRLGGKALWRDHEHASGYTLGMLLYPLSVLGLILAFHDELWKAAAVWALLAFGDGMAALLGQACGGPRLPWNARKGFVGLGSFVLFGTLGAAVLTGFTLRLPPSSWMSPRILGYVFVAAVAAALAETLPTTLDDNLTVPLIGAVALALATLAQPELLLRDPRLGAHALQGLGVNAIVALLAWRARAIDVPGAISAVLIGTAITVGTSLRGFALMAAFFVIGSAVTKLGYRIKAARGIAQEKGGARGWRNAWANGGVPALLALMAGLTPPDLARVFVLAYAASVATAAADTCSSEVGKAYGRRTFLITSLRPVPPGTEGAVSLEGTLGGLLGGALVALAGLLGSLAESVIGTVAERRGWLDNDLLNALNTALGAAFVVALLRLMAPAV